MMSAGHPFRQEALKILSGRLEETDSASRHKILSYCEHLRASYETRDIDFIRQVFSDDALIIVGHVVRSREGYNTALTDNSKSKIQYTVKKRIPRKIIAYLQFRERYRCQILRIQNYETCYGRRNIWRHTSTELFLRRI